MSAVIYPPSYKAGYARNPGEAANPNLWDGLVGAWLTSLGPTGLTLFDESGLHNDGALTNMAATDWVDVQGRQGLDFDGSNSRVIVSVANVLPLAFTTPKTFSLWFKADDISNVDRKFLVNLVTGSLASRMWIQDNEIGFTVFDGFFRGVSTPFTDTVSWHHFVATNDGTSDAGETRGYLDGVEMTGVFTRGGGNFSNEFVIGAGGSNSRNFDGSLSDIYAWDRVLIFNEVQLLFLDGLATVRLRSQFVPVPAAAAGEILVAESGTFALTGTDANLLVGHVIDADSGTFALSGTAANLVTGQTLVAESGTFALTGQDATLSTAASLTAESGTFALTGQDAELIPPGISLVAESGSFLLTGQDATLVTGEVLVAESGTFTLTGQDATLLVGHVLSAASGSFSLTGQDAFLLEGATLTAESASFALSGTAATLAAQFNLVAESGTFTLTGTAADVFRTQSVASSIVAKGARVSTVSAKLGRISGNPAVV